MYGRYITVDGQKIWVPCSPSTPMIKLIDRARAILAAEREAKE